MSEAPARTAVEFRVHGIGDHDDWSELGSPTLLVDGAPRHADIAEPPELPGHDLLLVNWARTSRRRSGWLWYLALPYTLVNAAGYMRRPKADPDFVRVERQVRTTSVVVGVLLSVLTYVWSVAIVETIARRSFLPVTSTRIAGTEIAYGVGVLLVLVMLIRRTRPGARTAAWIVWTNVAAVAAATVAAILVRPAHLRTASWVPDLFTTHGPSERFRPVAVGEPSPSFVIRVRNGEIVPYLDALTTVSIAAIAITVLLALVMIGRSLFLSKAERAWSAVWGSVLALVSGVVLMVSAASSLRLFVDNFVFYLSNHRLLPWGGPLRSAPYDARVMLPPLNREYATNDDYIIDLLAIIGILGAVAFVVALLLANLLPFGAGRPRFAGRTTKKADPEKAKPAAVWHRNLVLTLPHTLAPAFGLATLLALAGLYFVEREVDHGSPRSWLWTVAAVQAASVWTVLVIVAGRSIDWIKKPFSMFADLVGFWPVASHPLAGASYRHPVVESIVEQVVTCKAKVRVLVGHSQGSVLVAWSMAELPNPQENRVDLVTCGSPLQSLYAVFFPRQFSVEFFDEVRANSRSWTNFWRDTDPIATPVVAVDGADIRIPDPDAHGRLLVHGDYWIAPQQQDYIAGVIASSSSPAPDQPPPQKT